MPGRVVLVTGTGTSVGKTHFAEALLLAWRARGFRGVGFKPIETGLDTTGPSDAERLQRASAFHVKPSEYAFDPALSPHLAARRAAVPIRLSVLAAGLGALRDAADRVVVELAGGLFTPLGDGLLNAHLIPSLSPDAVLLVAPDRLGVLHDVIAAVTAAGALGTALHGVVLTAPAVPDDSTGTNAQELPRFLPLPILASLPRASPVELAQLPALERIASR